jgi:hypothetical protein
MKYETKVYLPFDVVRSRGHILERISPNGTVFSFSSQEAVTTPSHIHVLRRMSLCDFDTFSINDDMAQLTSNEIETPDNTQM